MHVCACVWCVWLIVIIVIIIIIVVVVIVVVVVVRLHHVDVDEPVDFKEHVRAVDALAGQAAKALLLLTTTQGEEEEEEEGKEEAAAAVVMGTTTTNTTTTTNNNNNNNNNTKEARLLRAARLITAALELPAATHGVNIYSRSVLLTSMAMFYAELGDFPNAVGSAGRAIQANPLSPRPYLLVARIQASLGNNAKADQALAQLERVFSPVCQRCHELDIKTKRQQKKKQKRLLSSSGGSGGVDSVCGDGCDEVKSALLLRSQLASGGGGGKQEL
jgi:predicted Zn-dependent protease